MEDSSMMSSINKAISYKEEIDCPEESGWTEYFEDFMNDNGDNTSSCSSDYGTSSLVSDAASCAAWKFSDHHQHDIKNRYSSIMGPQKTCKKLNFQKRRAKKVLLDDDDLEDTASSPCNSPKVGELSPFHISRRKREDWIDISLGSQKTDERNESRFIATEAFSIELKRRGLCLAPMSLLMNHLG